MKKYLLVAILLFMFSFILVLAEDQKTQPATIKPVSEETVVKSYTLHYVSPKVIREALKIYYLNCSLDDSSNLISVGMYKNNVAAFEEQLRKLDVEKKSILLRVFTVIAAQEGKSDTINNKYLERVLIEVSNQLNFKSYMLDGVSTIKVKDGSGYGSLALSSLISDNLRFEFKDISILAGNVGKRSIKLGFILRDVNPLISSETDITENCYLMAGVSRIGKEGKSIVLVINAEII